MKSKIVLDNLLYNSTPYGLSDSNDEWFEYRIQLVECVLHIEAKITTDDLYVGVIPRYKVRKITMVNE